MSGVQISLPRPIRQYAIDAVVAYSLFEGTHSSDWRQSLRLSRGCSNVIRGLIWRQTTISGDCSSAGRALDCDSGGRGFEPRQSPHYFLLTSPTFIPHFLRLRLFSVATFSAPEGSVQGM